MEKDNNQFDLDLSLWKYFTDDASKIKDRLWTMASWSFTIQVGITAFLAKHFKGESWDSLVVENKIMMVFTCIAAIAFSFYSIFMIKQYGNHIRSMWNRANLVRRRLTLVNELWFLNDKNDIKEDQSESGNENKQIPKVARTLVYMCYGFIATFLCFLFTTLK